MIILKSISILLSAIIVFAGSFFPSQKNIVDYLGSVEEIADNVFAVDYTLDYYSDQMMQKGVNTNIEMLIGGLIKVAKGNGGRFGCTTFNAKTPEGDYIFGRNYDYIKTAPLIIRTHPKNGYTSIGIVDIEMMGYLAGAGPRNEFSSILTMVAPYCCVDGMNEKGLSIGVLEIENLPTVQFTSKKNLTTTTMIRAVLDKAATLQEAIDIFKSYDMRDFPIFGVTYHYQIADAQGNSAVVEYVDGKMNVVYPEKKATGFEYITAANYLLTPGARDPKGFGHERTNVVKNTLNKTNGIATEKQAMDILKNASVNAENWSGFICYTLWSCVYNNSKRTLTICTNREYDKPISISVSDWL